MHGVRRAWLGLVGLMLVCQAVAAETRPVIGLSTSQFQHVKRYGDMLPDDVLTIRNIGTGTLYYTIEVDQPWLQVAPASGSSAGSTENVVYLSYYHASLLSAGPHAATVTVYATDGNAANDPQKVEVSVEVEPLPGDSNGDGDVDQDDFGKLQTCMGQPYTVPFEPGCAECDFNGDGRCDASDADVVLAYLTGPRELPPAVDDVPQYIFFNKSPTGPGPRAWRQSMPSTFTAASCRDIIDAVGTKGNERLRIGVSFPFSILDTDLTTLARSLRNLLAAADEADLPVLITLDGQNWWETRSDLWNWWDATLPGFNPDNRYNVEWTGWSPDSAVKIGWRNWGDQIRVRPAPNLASPAVLAQYWSGYDVIVPIISQWYEDLPLQRKYLFGGLKLGWEASINVNAYYHLDGNSYLERWPNDTSHDPASALHDPLQGWTWGLPPLGYAAVVAEGIKQSGTLTKADIEEVVRRYLERLSREANQRGIPRHLLFTHQGDTTEPWSQHLSFKPAMNAYSVPGWSFYSLDPASCGSLPADMDVAGRQQWAASEWYLAGANQTGWRQRFEASLRFRQCRFICVYNWENFREVPAALAAVREVVASVAD